MRRMASSVNMRHSLCNRVLHPTGNPNDKIFLCEAKTLSALRDRIVLYEKFYRQSVSRYGHSGGEVPSRNPEPKVSSETRTSQAPARAIGTGNSEQMDRGARIRKCWRCGNPGHLARMCSSRTQAASDDPSSRRAAPPAPAPNVVENWRKRDAPPVAPSTADPGQRSQVSEIIPVIAIGPALLLWNERHNWASICCVLKYHPCVVT